MLTYRPVSEVFVFSNFPDLTGANISLLNSPLLPGYGRLRGVFESNTSSRLPWSWLAPNYQPVPPIGCSASIESPPLPLSISCAPVETSACCFPGLGGRSFWPSSVRGTGGNRERHQREAVLSSVTERTSRASGWKGSKVRLKGGRDITYPSPCKRSAVRAARLHLLLEPACRGRSTVLGANKGMT